MMMTTSPQMPGSDSAHPNREGAYMHTTASHLPPFPFVAPAKMTPLDRLIAILAVEESSLKDSQCSPQDCGSAGDSPTPPLPMHDCIGDDQPAHMDQSDGHCCGSNRFQYPFPSSSSSPATVSPLALRLESPWAVATSNDSSSNETSPTDSEETHVAFHLTSSRSVPETISMHQATAFLDPPPSCDSMPSDPFDRIGFTLEFTLQPPGSPRTPRPVVIAMTTHPRPAAAAPPARHGSKSRPFPNPHLGKVKQSSRRTKKRTRPTFVTTDPLPLPPPRPIATVSTAKPATGRNPRASPRKGGASVGSTKSHTDEMPRDKGVRRQGTRETAPRVLQEKPPPVRTRRQRGASMVHVERMADAAKAAAVV